MKRWEWKPARAGQEIYYYNSCRNFIPEEFAGRLAKLIEEERVRKGKQETVFLCIGTDRSTGDSLGPLIGYKLKRMRIPGAAVFGTLERPVHAMNLEHYLEVLRVCYSDALIVAVDASVGNREHVGYVTLGKGPLKPGLGVSKELRAVGDIFITGIVGSCGSCDPLYLQSVRLSLVMELADCISTGVGLVEKLWDRAAMV
ncbi:MAG: spore protease YyaC [Clostridium sp.]|nr:spore protease YyaC [Clostridium sp.]